MLLIAAPWHVLATLRNPPYFDFTMRSVPGEYHGFLWFYFINEQVLRFLNLRYPRDYNTVPRAVFLAVPPALAVSLERLFSGGGEAVVQAAWIAPGGRACWRSAGPASCWCSSLSPPRRNITRCRAIRRWRCCWARPWRRAAIGSGAARACWRRSRPARRWRCVAILVAVRNVPAPGDISQALSQHPGAYTLSLGHMEDLTLESFAYLRLPLAIAAVAFLVGALGQPAGRGAARLPGRRADDGAVLPRRAAGHGGLRSLPVVAAAGGGAAAVAAGRAGGGPSLLHVLVDLLLHQSHARLLNGRFNNLVYGSYAPGAPDVFLDDAQWKNRWLGPRALLPGGQRRTAGRDSKSWWGRARSIVVARKRRQDAADQSAAVKEKGDRPGGLSYS